ncbi:hypothetical protein SHEWT2_03292 [Shewanella hafniensis]|jgi:hypothetical protein|nr:hypothetical protein SHEWT2_03292 [Shewanella hafniensis]
MILVDDVQYSISGASLSLLIMLKCLSGVVERFVDIKM